MILDQWGREIEELEPEAVRRTIGFLGGPRAGREEDQRTGGLADAVGHSWTPDPLGFGDIWG